MEKMTVREWQEAYKAGKFDNDMIGAGWYDWFCSDRALAGRLKKLAPIVLGVTNPDILDNYYVWFKNNCPISGPLYDDIRFEPLDESLREEKYFMVIKDDPRERSKWVLLSMKDINNGRPGYGVSNARDIVKHINFVRF